MISVNHLLIFFKNNCHSFVQNFALLVGLFCKDQNEHAFHALPCITFAQYINRSAS